MLELFANSGDPDQMPHSVASDLGLHCLPIALLGVSRLQWVERNGYTSKENNSASPFWPQWLSQMLIQRDQEVAVSIPICLATFFCRD